MVFDWKNLPIWTKRYLIVILYRFGPKDIFWESLTDLDQKISFENPNRLPIWIVSVKKFYRFGSVIQNGKRYSFDIFYCFYRSGSDSLPI